ncbi:aldo/keto reductase [Jiangella sp. DSM 45060]|uniref:aldo/keto reductase n=1 Tax=Jiangella sp. DSM 45060 TaxID=1798224 RepID=UPI00087A550B|nr:aldo/keto reductase [Jiangella sp. DSM 45060]SDT72814.1 D-threo-aldose 1-dehydrogenase [Jiangella sp. DSM 45060]
MTVALPRLGIGTAAFGGLFTPVAEADALDAVRVAAELGVGYFDTAPRYGHGLAETRLARGLRETGADAVVSTKVGWLLRDGDAVEPDWTERGIRASLESSLERLGRDHVDIAFIHDPDDAADEVRRTAFPALRRLRDEGLVRAIGFGMNHADPLAALVREHDVDVVLIAGRFTLLDHRALTTLLPACADTATQVVVGGVFNTGLLAAPSASTMYDYRPVGDDVLARALRCEEICARYGVPLAAAAAQFPLLHPAVGTVLVGCRSGAEVAANVAAAGHEIPAALWTELAAAGYVPAELLAAV